MLPRPARSRGLSLIVVLLILIVIAVLGLGGAQMALLGSKSARYNRDRAVAWQAAQAALVDAQYDITTGTRSGKFSNDPTHNPLASGFRPQCGTGGNQGLCFPNPAGKPLAYTVDFTDHATDAASVAIGTFTGRPFDAGSTGIRPAQKPRYIIEAIRDTHVQSSLGSPSTTPPTWLYRITAMGFGPTTDTQVVLQMVFKKGV